MTAAGIYRAARQLLGTAGNVPSPAAHVVGQSCRSGGTVCTCDGPMPKLTHHNTLQAGKVPGPYLAMLEDVSATALVAVLSVPTFREQRHPESCAKVPPNWHDVKRH